MVKCSATFGANCTIVGGVTIGKYAFIGAGAVINRDVPDYALMAGVPARQIGWMSRFGKQLKFKDLAGGSSVSTCPNTGELYKKDENERGSAIA